MCWLLTLESRRQLPFDTQGLAVLLIAAYGLGMLFSLRTPRECFCSEEHREAGEAVWPLGVALITLAGVTVLVAPENSRK